MRCSECDKVCLFDWAIEHVKSSDLNVCDLPTHISDKAVSSKPLMTFDNALTLSRRYLMAASPEAESTDATVPLQGRNRGDLIRH